MLDLTQARLSLEDLKAIFDVAGENMTENSLDPLEMVQERVMENVIDHIVNYLASGAKFMKSLPVTYTQGIEDTLENLVNQIVENATESGLLIGAGEDDDAN